MTLLSLEILRIRPMQPRLAQGLRSRLIGLHIHASTSLVAHLRTISCGCVELEVVANVAPRVVRFGIAILSISLRCWTCN